MSTLIPDAAVQAIQDSVKTDILRVGQTDYVTRPVYDPREPDPTPTPLVLTTLTGFVNYLQHNLDELDPTLHAIHIRSHDHVELVSNARGRFKQRDIWAVTRSATIFDSGFCFDKFYGPEEFTIALQTLFVDSHDRANVLALVGNIREEEVRSTGDDGVTQSVICKSGIALVREVAVPNPVFLCPYRTFRELDQQPASPFILRVRKGANGALPLCALFECDGGGWKLDAIDFIHARLVTLLTLIEWGGAAIFR